MENTIRCRHAKPRLWLSRGLKCLVKVFFDPPSRSSGFRPKGRAFAGHGIPPAIRRATASPMPRRSSRPLPGSVPGNGQNNRRRVPAARLYRDKKTIPAPRSHPVPPGQGACIVRDQVPKCREVRAASHQRFPLQKIPFLPNPIRAGWQKARCGAPSHAGVRRHAPPSRARRAVRRTG